MFGILNTSLLYTPHNSWYLVSINLLSRLPIAHVLDMSNLNGPFGRPAHRATS